MSLTALCPTIDPGPQVRELLEQLRPGVDEIVVAADSRAPAEDLAEYAAAADRLVRFEWRGPNRALARLAEECSGDWLLEIAGDEVASPSLVAQLPALTHARGIRQYWVPVRWLHRDAGHYLAGRPWFPDYHARLVRNDGTLYCPGVRHSGVEPELPARWLEAPLYHLDLILHGEAERRAKAERNERERPGLPAPGGGALNESYYLPELQAEPALAAVPAADRDAIEAVLAAGPGRRPAPQPGEVPLSTGRSMCGSRTAAATAGPGSSASR